MSTEPLAIYLNDHLAGSVAALELIDTLAEHERGRPVQEKLRALRLEIEEDQGTLRQILGRIDADEHRLKQVAAWVSEKVSQARLTLANRAHPTLATVEGLEALGLGIQGKLALWFVLADLAPRDPRLAGFDYEALETRANIQHAVVERERIEAARVAFAPATVGATER
jgi:hypothetical protein